MYLKLNWGRLWKNKNKEGLYAGFQRINEDIFVILHIVQG